MITATHPARLHPGRGGTSLKAIHNRRRDLRGTFTISCDQRVDELRSCRRSETINAATDSADARTRAAALGWASSRDRYGRTRDHCPDHPPETT